MKMNNIEEVISSSINNYLKKQVNSDFSTFDEYFDELFFLHVIFERYSKELTTTIAKYKYLSLKKRYNDLLFNSTILVEKQRQNILNKSFFNQSQIMFNILGIQYLLSLKKEYKDTVFTLRNEEKQILTKSIGYSALYDNMVEFFCIKLNIPLPVDKAKPNTKVEETYLYTHFFLMESDYFVKKCDLDNDNIYELKSNIDFVIEEKLGDLIAELYWALNYFNYKDYIQLQKLRGFLLTSFMDGEWNFNYKDLRQLKHSQYSCIAAFLEELKRGISYE